MILKVENLHKQYKKIEVLNGISFEVKRGECFALLGPNGSGKSTVLKSITGAVNPNQGSIAINGNSDIQSNKYKNMMVYMPQLIQLPAHLPVKSVIALFKKLRSVDESRFARLVSDLNIDSFFHKPFINLSGGMKQKINILLSFMYTFEIAFLDEPTSSLDPQVAYYLKQLLKELQGNGKTIVFTSHIMNEVEELADTVAIIDKGKIKEMINPQAFIKNLDAENFESALLRYYRQEN